MIQLRLQQSAKDLTLEEIRANFYLSDTDSLIEQVALRLEISSTAFQLFHKKDGFTKRVVIGWECAFYNFEPNDCLELKMLDGQYLQFKISRTESSISSDSVDERELFTTQVVRDKTEDSRYEALVGFLKENNSERFSKNINQKLLDTSNQNSWTLFHWACYYGNLEAIKQINLLGLTYDINQVTFEGWTPIMIAIRQANMALFRYLMNFPSLNMDMVTQQGTALHMACKMRQKEMIQILSQKGCNMLIRDLNSMSCYDISNEQIQMDLLAITNGVEQISEIQTISQIKPFIAKGVFYVPGSSPWTVKRRYFIIDPLQNTLSRYKESGYKQLCQSIPLNSIQNLAGNYTSFQLKGGYVFIQLLYNNNQECFIGAKTQEKSEKILALLRQAISYVKNVEKGLQMYKNAFQPIQELDLDNQSVVQVQSQPQFQRRFTQSWKHPPPMIPPLVSTNYSPKFSDFILGDLLGQGAFGCVFECTHRRDNKTYAIKVMNKEKAVSKKQLKYTVAELQILRMLDHPFIVKLQFAFQTPSNLYLAMEICRGGDLYSLLQKFGFFREDIAKFYIAETLLALEYVHSLDIVYRDLKPENILLQEDGHIRLADFGLCKQSVPFELAVRSFCGSPAYLPPELLREKKVGKYGDYYQLGVLAYELLVGIPPFLGNSIQEVYKKIEFEEMKFPLYMDKNAMQLIRALTYKDPYSRINFGQAKQNPFFEKINWNELLELRVKPPYIPKERTRNMKFKHANFQDFDYSDNEIQERVVDYDYARQVSN